MARFMEDVNTQRRIFLSLSIHGCSLQEFNSRKFHPHLTFKTSWNNRGERNRRTILFLTQKWSNTCGTQGGSLETRAPVVPDYRWGQVSPTNRKQLKHTPSTNERAIKQNILNPEIHNTSYYVCKTGLTDIRELKLPYFHDLPLTHSEYW